MLVDLEREFPDDPQVLTELGRAFLATGQPLAAARRFERVLALGSRSAVNEENTGRAWLRAGQIDKAALHLERALASDPLLLPAAELLVQVYRQQGRSD